MSLQSKNKHWKPKITLPQNNVYTPDTYEEELFNYKTSCPVKLLSGQQAKRCTSGLPGVKVNKGGECELAAQ